MARILTILKSSLNVKTLSLARLANRTSTTSSLTATCRGLFGNSERRMDAPKLKTKMAEEAKAEAAKKAKKLSNIHLMSLSSELLAFAFFF
jgi:hypothetical protein